MGQALQSVITSLLCGSSFAMASIASASGTTLDYMGEIPPGETAKLFAPGVVSTEFAEDAGLVFTPDGNEVFIRLANYPMGVNTHRLRVNDKWQAPEVAPFSGRYWEGRLALMPNGSRLFYSSPSLYLEKGRPRTMISGWWSEWARVGVRPFTSAHRSALLSPLYYRRKY